MMVLALLASATDPAAFQIERSMAANGHSWQSLLMASLSNAMTPAMALVWSSAAGVPKASHPLWLHGVQAGSANNEARQRKKGPRGRIIS